MVPNLMALSKTISMCIKDRQSDTSHLFILIEYSWTMIYLTDGFSNEEKTVKSNTTERNVDG